MGKVVVSTMVSVDGYTEGAGGDVSQMPMDLAFAEHNADRVRFAGRLLFGGTSYRGMMRYWPNQVDNPDAIPEDRYIASRYATDLGITVVSPTPTSPPCARRMRTTSSFSAAAHSGPICSPPASSTRSTCSSARRSSLATTGRSPACHRSTSPCWGCGRGGTRAPSCCRTGRTTRRRSSRAEWTTTDRVGAGRRRPVYSPLRYSSYPTAWSDPHRVTAPPSSW
jgi:hypothetical protein